MSSYNGEKPPKDRSCDGKQAFESFSLARDRAKRMRNNNKGPIEPYHCLYCGKTHLGTARDKPKPKQRILRHYED